MDEVYNFRDGYFETHSESEAGEKQGEVAQRMQKALRKLEEKEGKIKTMTTENSFIFWGGSS